MCVWIPEYFRDGELMSKKRKTVSKGTGTGTVLGTYPVPWKLESCLTSRR